MSEAALPPVSPEPRRRLKDGVQEPKNEDAEIRRMWTNGPLRRWARARLSSNWIPYETGGFVAGYVCDGCRQDVAGVYRVAPGCWLCGSCKSGKAKRGKR